MNRLIHFLRFSLLFSLGAQGQTGPLFDSWVLNEDGAGGNEWVVETIRNTSQADQDDIVFEYNNRTYKASLQSFDDSTDVKKISYSDDYVYVWSGGLTSYNMGPYIFDGNTNTAEEVTHLWKIPRNPQEETGNKTSATLGSLAVFINGIPYFPPSDGNYYYNEQGSRLWKRDAGVMEASGFDCSGGHPAEQYYHYHRIPSPDVVHGVDTMCETFASEGLFSLDDTKHSPIIGWGFDGYPIYGPYGYSDPNDVNSAIRRMESSYQKRTYANGERTSYFDDNGSEVSLSPDQYGPDVDETVNGTTYPLGAFFEDYVYEENSGDLNEWNMRWCITPEYPDGTYAYFATIYEDLSPAFPYIMGEELWGVAAEENLSSGGPGNLSGSVTVDETVTEFFPSISAVRNNEEAAEIIQLYPNPANDFATMNLTRVMGHDVHIEVLDAFGAVVQSEFMSSLNYALHVLNVSSLDSGIYTVKVSTLSNFIAQQLVVK